jgi:hypothetical protein
MYKSNGKPPTRRDQSTCYREQLLGDWSVEQLERDLVVGYNGKMKVIGVC